MEEEKHWVWLHHHRADSKGGIRARNRKIEFRAESRKSYSISYLKTKTPFSSFSSEVHPPGDRDSSVLRSLTVGYTQLEGPAPGQRRFVVWCWDEKERPPTKKGRAAVASLDAVQVLGGSWMLVWFHFHLQTKGSNIWVEMGATLWLFFVCKEPS